MLLSGIVNDRNFCSTKIKPLHIHDNIQLTFKIYLTRYQQLYLVIMAEVDIRLKLCIWLEIYLMLTGWTVLDYIGPMVDSEVMSHRAKCFTQALYCIK